MVPRTATRWLEILSAAWWASALGATGLMLTFAPISNEYPGPDGCFFVSGMIFDILCHGTWNDDIVGALLSWALYWTVQSPTMLILAVAGPNVISGSGFIAVWLASLVLALRFCIDAIRRIRQPQTREGKLRGD